ncbi:MAG: hypothetical protein RIR10_300 [Planctomycetota bacterium]
MRAFWTVVVLLAAVGLWFVFVPRESNTATAVRSNDALQVDPSTRSDESTEAATKATTEAPAVQTQTNTSTSREADAINDMQTAVDATTIALPDFDLLGESGKVIQSPNAPSKTVRIDTRNPSEIVRRIDERTVELDGRYRVTGNGSANDPYVISWELLTSASEFIDLTQNARTPPPWVRLLDGTYVQISGYYSTAVRVSVAKNLLLTLNRWDGCCIGVPPTPFDAIDIDMRKPLPMGGMHLIRFGTFRGQLRVEPVEAASYLLGFYRLEDATFETK